MKELATYVISGAVSGGIYAMLAAGVVLTYQTSGVFNFAHGAVAFASAFLSMQLNTGLGWPVWPAAVLAVLVLPPLLGLALDRAIYRRLGGAPEVVRLVVPIALLVVIPATCLLVVDRLNDEIRTAGQSDALRDLYAREGTEPGTLSAGEFGSFVAAEVARWSRLARERNITID